MHCLARGSRSSDSCQSSRPHSRDHGRAKRLQDLCRSHSCLRTGTKRGLRNVLTEIVLEISSHRSSLRFIGVSIREKHQSSVKIIFQSSDGFVTLKPVSDRQRPKSSQRRKRNRSHWHSITQSGTPWRERCGRMKRRRTTPVYGKTMQL